MQDQVEKFQRKLTYLKQRKNWPTWILSLCIGVLVFVFLNYGYGFSPFDGKVYFIWFTKLNQMLFWITLPLIPISLLLIFAWISSQIKSSILGDVVIIGGYLFSIFFSIFLFIILLFSVSFLETIDEVTIDKKNSYSLLRSSKGDNKEDFYFCESKNWGFSGNCVFLVHQRMSMFEIDPFLFVDKSTGFITIISEQMDTKWIMTDSESLHLKSVELNVNDCTE